MFSTSARDPGRGWAHALSLNVGYMLAIRRDAGQVERLRRIGEFSPFALERRMQGEANSLLRGHVMVEVRAQYHALKVA